MPHDETAPGDPATAPGDPATTPGVRSLRRGRHAAPAGPAPSGTGTAGAVRAARRAALAELGEDLRLRAPRVDGYEVHHLLGAGGSGVVWAGTGPDGQRRALKVLQPVADGADGPGGPEGPGGTGGTAGGAGPLRELALLRRVRHPRVVAVHDISRDGAGRPVLVLDLAPGGSLAEVLRRRGRLGAAEVVGLLAVLGPALEELHSAGVVHGDVSPGNVLLDARGEPLLADLGLARAIGRPHGSVLGTPGFADPAVVAGGAAGAASDVYGLAAVAWWALTGQAPPSGGSGVGRRAVRRAGAALPAGTSTELLGVLREGLHRTPSRRPTPGELAQAAAGCAQPRPVRSSGAGPWAAGAPARGGDAAPAGGGGTSPAHPGDSAAVPVTRPLRPAVPAAVPAAAPAPLPARTGRVAARPGSRGSGPGASRRPGRRVLAGAAAALVVAAGVSAAVALRPGGPAADAVPVRAAAPAEPAQPSEPTELAQPAAPRTPLAVAPAAAPPPVAAAAAAPVPAVPVPAAGDEAVGVGAIGVGAVGVGAVGVGAAGRAGEGEVGDGVLLGADLPAVVRELAARRADALRSADPAALAGVDAPGSPALAADEALLVQLAAAGSRWSGLGFDVLDVAVEVAQPGRAVVVAEVVTQAHEVLGPDGAVSSVPASAPRASRLTLVRVEGQWRVRAVG
ncbi:serine/threonine-protein kinase [Kineococcus gypseus]|uniref:serine/threonine-protein kinase n=1 Tax=Kineococcus gypseus TaxID=1637102 RepID=UPI003D7D35A0